MQVNTQSAKPNKLGWWSRIKNNNKQNQTVVGGRAIIMAGSLHIVWGIWIVPQNSQFLSDISDSILIPMIASFYLAAIIGSLAGAFLVTRLKKDLIYYLCLAINTVSGILLITWHREFGVFVASRILSGLSYGIAYLVFIIHVSGVANESHRPRLLAKTNLRHLLVTFYLLFFSGYIFLVSDMTIERFMGFFILQFSVVGIVLTKIYTKESITYLLQKNSEKEAYQMLIQLHNESLSNIPLEKEFGQLKEMVAADKVANGGVFLSDNVKQLCIATANRLLSSSLVNNLILNFMFFALFFEMTFLEDYIIKIILVSIKIVAALFANFVSIEFERRWVVFSSALLCSLLALVLVFIVQFSDDPSNALIVMLICLFQFVISAGVEPMQHVVLGEAFSMKQQPWSIAFVTIVDYSVSFLIIISFYSVFVVYSNVFLFTLGGIIGVLAFSQLALPHTKNLTLKVTVNAFRNARI